MSYAQIISQPGVGYGPQTPTRRVYQPSYLQPGASPNVNAPSNDPNVDASARATGSSQPQNPAALPSAPAGDQFVKPQPAAKPPTTAAKVAPGELTTKQKIQVYGPTAAALGLGVPGIALYVAGIGHNMFNAKNMTKELVFPALKQKFRNVPNELVPKLKEMAAQAEKTGGKIRIVLADPLGTQMQKWGMRLLGIGLIPRTIGGIQYATASGQTPIVASNLVTLFGILPSLWAGSEIMLAVTSLLMGGFYSMGQANVYDKNTHVPNAHRYDMTNVEQIFKQGKQEAVNMSADLGGQLQGLLQQAGRFLARPLRPEDKARLSQALDLPEGSFSEATLASAVIMGHMVEDIARGGSQFLATMSRPELAKAWFESKKESMRQTYDDIVQNRGAGDRTRVASTLFFTSAALVGAANLPGVKERLGRMAIAPGMVVFSAVAINNLAQLILGIHDIKKDSVPVGGLYAGGALLDLSGITLVSAGGNPQIGTALAQLGAVATQGASSSDAANKKAEELLNKEPPKPEVGASKEVPGAQNDHPSVGQAPNPSAASNATSKPSPFKILPPGLVPGPGLVNSSQGSMSFGNDVDPEPAGPPRQGLRRDCGDPIHGIVTPPF